MDSILLQRIKNQDKKAFEELYDQYANYALRVATAVLGSSGRAADAVQETFIRVYYGMDRFNQYRPFEPWFYKILINECNRILKKGSKVSYISDYMETRKDMSEEDAYHFEEYEELYQAIEALDSSIRIPIVLKYLKGFQELEIAGILNLNINTLKSRLYKGRQKLKEAMKCSEERRQSSGTR